MEIFGSDLLVALVALATPILFPAIGELIAERAGIFNIGLEGMMLAGAFTAFWTAWQTGSVWLGACAGMAGGVCTAALVAALVIDARGQQIVVGIGINILAVGLTAFANASIFEGGDRVSVNPMDPLAVPWLSDIPFLGRVLFAQTPLVYLAYASVPAAWILLKRTNWGLVLRATGEAPEAVDTSGHSVRGVRWAAALVAGAGAGLGGAMLTVGQIGVFNSDITGGRGFIALAAVIFGRWHPVGVLCACLVFGGADALQLRLQAEPFVPPSAWLLLTVGGVAYAVSLALRSRRGGATPSIHLIVAASIALAGVLLAIISPRWDIPGEAWLTLPYVMTLLVLAGVVVGKARVPRALGVPYDRARTA